MILYTFSIPFKYKPRKAFGTTILFSSLNTVKKLYTSYWTPQRGNREIYSIIGLLFLWHLFC